MGKLGDKKIKKVLVLGSGALKIGEAGEFDYSGSQAIKALKSEGIETVLVNPNIATIQTSKELADCVYFVPVKLNFVEKVIAKERPDGILLSMGGQTALNCGIELDRHGILDKYRLKVLGTSIDTIKKTEDRRLFKKELVKLGLSVPKSQAVKTVSQAMKAGVKLKFPLILRVAYALGGLGSRVVRDKKELESYAQIALASSPQVLVEEYLEGWKEIEYEVVRDSHDNCITVCNMENVDPMGIHTGESIVVAPSQTLTNYEYQFLRNISIKVIRSLCIVGECNIQFALNASTFDYRIIEVNARLSRSSALASKATGYPLAFIAAKLALGRRLDELKNTVTGKTSAFFEPALDYIVVKIPRWDLEKFRYAKETIGSEMKSVGEVMAIGISFQEAIQKAARMLDQGYEGVIVDEFLTLSRKKIIEELKQPSPRRLFLIAAALSKNTQVKQLSEITYIDPWFLFRLKEIAKVYNQLSPKNLTKSFLNKAKKQGFSDLQIGRRVKKKANAIRKLRKSFGIVPNVRAIDTLAGEFPAETNYLYLTYHAIQDEAILDKERKIVILGSGPYRIGSSVEFDWCAVNTVIALKKRGYRTVMINCNPETVSTDYDYADKLYFEELTSERVLDIWEKELAEGIVLSVGGQIPNNLASFCQLNKIKLLGTKPSSILRAEDRKAFSNLLEKLDISQPPWDELLNVSDVKRFAKSVGYPILARPSFVLSGEAMSVLYSDRDVELYLENGRRRGLKGEVVVSKFMEGSREIDYDAVAAEGRVIIRAISEHVEYAGVHSGDATLVLPPYRIGNEVIGELDRIVSRIALSLSISGPFNIQFLERNGYLMVIECNLRCSRSFPFVSKVTGVNFMDIGVSAMLGEKLDVVSMPSLRHVGVKAAQFSFSRIKGADPILRVEMASTGEVATLGTSIYDALLKSLIATGFVMPRKSIFLSIGGWDSKEAFFPYAKVLHEMGISIFGTDKTSKFLKQRRIPCKRVAKIGEQEQRVNAVDLIKNKKVDLVINITEPPVHGEETIKFRKRLTDGYYIRRTAIDFHVPLITNLELAMLFVRSFREKHFQDLEVLPVKSYLEGKASWKFNFKKGGEAVEKINKNWKGKDIVSVDQFQVADLNQLFQLVRKIKKDVIKGKLHNELMGKIMAAIFYEPSSRTFGSFVTAMQRLGGGIIPLQGVVYSSVAKGELLPDTVRTFASYADVVVLRYPEEGGAKIAAQYSPVPVINAGDGPGEHPTQALLDLFTIIEHFKKLNGLTIGMVGDLLYGRTIHSLAKLLALYSNIKFHFVSPDILRVKRQFKNELKKRGVKLIESDNLSRVIGEFDVLYMTRVQKERFVDLEEYEKVKNYYILTPELMKRAKESMIVMHPFPRVGEISYDVDSDPRAVYIKEEIRNGLYVRMALLLLILGKTYSGTRTK